jgi:hypothetical protein
MAEHASKFNKVMQLSSLRSKLPDLWKSASREGNALPRLGQALTRARRIFL